MQNDKLALKFFKVNPKYLNDYGELKPEAELLPYYGNNHKTVDKVGQERDLLSPGSDASRAVVLIDKDGTTYSRMGRDKVHGASAYGYPYIDETLHSDVPSMIDSFDPLGKFGMRDDNNKDEYYTTSIRFLPDKELNNIYDFERDYFDRINKVLSDKLWYGADAAPVAMLMLANENDIVSAYDMLNNNFDAWRDNSIDGGYEVQLKRAMPIKQVTRQDIDKGKVHIYPDNEHDFLQWLDKHKYDDKKRYEKGIQYIKEKLADKYPGYKYMSDDEFNSRMYIPHVGSFDNLYSYTDDDMYNLIHKISNDGLYDTHRVMDNVFPGKSNMTVSDKQYKNIIKGFYDGLPDNYKRQKNITDSILTASRY